MLLQKLQEKKKKSNKLKEKINARFYTYVLLVFNVIDNLLVKFVNFFLVVCELVGLFLVTKKVRPILQFTFFYYYFTYEC